MTITAKNIFVVAAKRTAFGTFGGKLKNLSAIDLAEAACRAAVQAAGVEPANVDSIIVGNVLQTSRDAAYLARHVGLRIGLPVHVPALNVNRLCGSGFQSIVNAAHEILVGDANIVVAAGTENMSQAPFSVRNVRFGTGLGQKYDFEDTLWEGLTDSHCKSPMGVTAENLGAQYKITRKESDEFAIRSQTRWRLANNAGHFKSEIASIKVKGKKGEEVFEVDEHPRDTTVEALGQLPTLFKKENGLVNAGNASGVSDGAGAIILANEDAVKKHHLTPLARLVGWNAVGCEPTIMGIGPVYAIRNLLKSTNTKLEDIDLVEVNEAFAPQYLAVEKELKLNPDKTNVDGGAIALGHPLGASGSRITAHLVHELRRRKAKYGIGSACIGGGQGIALLLESIH